MAQNFAAGDDFSGMFTHQTIVGGDIRFALGGVDNQRFNFAVAAF